MSRSTRIEPAMPATTKKLRCAVYTRKSTDEGLEKEYNTLDAQRDSCEAYITSQRAEGWVLVRDRYDDGGFSGGTLERPALQRLLRDVEAGLVDCVVAYRLDRLSRSLTDFVRMMERLEAHGVTFVSVTQSFNTTTSMGRLTLNILLSFAQFEREVIGERIRDKFAASRARGMWMGGKVPLGYDVVNRKLIVNEDEAPRVRRVFEIFAETGSGVEAVRRLQGEGATSKTGRPLDKGDVYKLLNNRTYVGELYAIETEVRGKPPDIRREARQARSKILVEALFTWLETQLARLPGSAPTAEKIRYALNHRAGLERFLDDGMLEMDNNTAERCIRPLVLSRKNALFASGDDGGERWACIASLVETCKLNGVNPQLYFTDVLTRLVNGWMESRIDELMPWHWVPAKNS